MPSCLLNSDHVNELLILLFLATYNFVYAFFLGFVKYFALTIFTWACLIYIRRFIQKNLTKLICKKTLFRLKKSHNSTHWEPFALNKFMKIKLSFYLCLCLFKKLVAFGLLASLNKAFKEAHRIELLVYTKVLNQSLHQFLSFWVIFWCQILLSKFFLSLV